VFTSYKIAGFRGVASRLRIEGSRFTAYQRLGPGPKELNRESPGSGVVKFFGFSFDICVEIGESRSELC